MVDPSSDGAAEPEAAVQGREGNDREEDARDKDFADGDDLREPGETGAAAGVSEEDEEKKELREKYLRLYAEFDNFRKRVAREREELLSRATEKVVTDILTVIDHLELALQHRENDSAEGLFKGVEITLREFTAALEKNGVTAIEAKGRPFDPAVHHAMTQVATAEAAENTVVEEFRKGYRLGERVLRPSLVAVAKPPSEDEAAGGTEGASAPDAPSGAEETTDQ